MTASLSSTGIAERMQARLAACGDAVFAEGQQRFFQHQVVTYGVRTNLLHQIDREFWREVKALPIAQRDTAMNALWKDPHLESGTLACYLYRRFSRSCGEREFRLFERWIDRHVCNWAHCDGVASWLLAACIGNEPELRHELTAWTGSPNLWKRRASAVALLQEAKQGRHTSHIFSIARVLLPDREDMVQKGVGWLLKETYPAKPKETVAFLMQHGSTASRLTLRYAAEKMSPEDRRRVLA